MTDWTNIPPNPLTNLEAQIRAHWAEHRPKMVAALEAAGKLEQAIAQAAEDTKEAVINHTAENGKGRNSAEVFFEAWELYRNEWAFLPAEEEANDDNEEEDELDRLLAERTAEFEAFIRERSQPLDFDDEDEDDEA